MPADRQRQIEAVFDTALAASPAERPALLDDLCNDEAMRETVEALLADYDSASGFFGSFVQDVMAPLLDGLEVSAALEGQRLGAYRLMEEVGRGGMGIVYRAVRADGQYEQQVAVKIMRPGAFGEQAQQAFFAERQMLANLVHPHIARLLDGGVTEEGLPYLVMEWVDGRPITRFAGERQGSLHERLLLFDQVCDAVQHAHQAFIVHRDLKPSNLLVNEAGEVKLLDFGIAHLTSNAGSSTASQRMTPAYASPEQMRGEGVTAASDVYQLGVLLHELLTGQRPAHASDLGREKELVRSSLITTARALKDLEAIVWKALCEDPQARYQTVGQLHDDLRRYRAGFPVTARPNTLCYRTRCFLVRNRWGMAAAMTVVLALLSGLVFSLWQAEQARRERDRAEQIATLMTDLFSSPDPYDPAIEEMGKDITVTAFLDTGEARVRGELGGQPDLLGEMLFTIAKIRYQLGDAQAAFETMEEVVPLMQQTHGMASSEVAQATQWLAFLYHDLSRYEKADSLYRVSIATFRTLYPDGHPDLASALLGLGSLQTDLGLLGEADASLLEAVAMYRAAGEAHVDDLASALDALAELYEDRGNLDRAAQVWGEAIQLRQQSLGNDHPRTAIVQANSARIAYLRGDYEQATQTYKSVLATLQAALGNDHPNVDATRNQLAMTLTSSGNYEAGETLYRKVLEIRQQRYGEMHEHTAGAWQNLGTNLAKQARWQEALACYRQAQVIYQQVLPAGHYLRAFPLASISTVQREQGQVVQAESAARDALAILHKTFEEDHPIVAEVQGLLGRALATQGQHAEAEAVLLPAYQRLHEEYGNASPATQKLIEALVELYETWGREADAARYRALRVPDRT